MSIEDKNIQSKQSRPMLSVFRQFTFLSGFHIACFPARMTEVVSPSYQTAPILCLCDSLLLQS